MALELVPPDIEKGVGRVCIRDRVVRRQDGSLTWGPSRGKRGARSDTQRSVPRRHGYGPFHKVGAIGLTAPGSPNLGRDLRASQD